MPSDATSPDDEALARWLLARHPPKGAATTDAPCPDADLLAGFAEGRLPEEGRARVEGHVASCPECRALVADLVSIGAAPVAHVAARRTWFLPLAVAAVLLLAVGVAVFLSSDPSSETSKTSSVDLAAAAHELATARPDLFAGFEPLSAEDLTVPESVRVRGGLALHFPTGVLLYPRPTFRWGTMPGVKDYRVSLLGADGKVLWSGTAMRPPYEYPPDAPPLADGARYSWEVSAKGVAGEVTGSLGFSIASTADATRAVEAGRVIATRYDGLVFAHWLARHEMWEAADAQLRSLVALPHAEDAQHLWHYVRARMGGVAK